MRKPSQVTTSFNRELLRISCGPALFRSQEYRGEQDKHKATFDGATYFMVAEGKQANTYIHNITPGVVSTIRKQQSKKIETTESYYRWSRKPSLKRM